jgi:hypothetical protein
MAIDQIRRFAIICMVLWISSHTFPSKETLFVKNGNLVNATGNPKVLLWVSEDYLKMGGKLKAYMDEAFQMAPESAYELISCAGASAGNTSPLYGSRLQ